MALAAKPVSAGAVCPGGSPLSIHTRNTHTRNHSDIMANPFYQHRFSGYLPFLLCQSLFIFNVPGAAGQENHSDYDWVPRSQLSAEQLAELAPGCHGMYVDPIVYVPSPTTLEDAELVIESDSSSMENGQQFVIEGNVKVSHGPRSISADSMVFDRANQQAELSGDVEIRNPGLLIRGQKASMSTKDEEASFEQARFVMHAEHMRGSADAIEQDTKGVVVLRGGSITTCEPDRTTWRISGEEIRLDQEKRQGTARNVTLRVAEIPVVYLPWFSFPLGDERQSGFLVPAIASSESGGLDIALPWYWNLAPNYDMTITPRLVSGRGAMLETENRYMNRHMEGDLKLAFLADDDGGADPDVDIAIDNGEVTESEARPYTGNNRWLVQTHQRGGLAGNRGWYSFLDASKVSDVDYFRDVGNESFSQSNQSYVDQLVQVGYIGDHWYVQGNIHERQRLLEDLEQPLRLLPQLRFDGYYRVGDFKLSLQNQISRFDHDEELRADGSPIVKGTRRYLDYRLSRSWRNSWAFANAHAGYKFLGYSLEEESLADGVSRTPSAAAPQFGLDLGVIFERPGKHYLQTIEPRVFRFYRAYSDHSDFYDITNDDQDLNFDTTQRTLGYNQFFRDSRFTGHDRLDDANRSTIGVTSRLLSNKDGRELMQVSLGHVLHYATRQVSLDGTPETREQREIAVNASVSLGPVSRIYASTIYNTEQNEAERASAGFNYASPGYRFLANLSWSWVRDFQQLETNARNLDQIDASFAMPLNPQWHLMGRYNYDVEESQHLETFLGVEYNACCYKVRVLARRWLDSNIATLVEDEDLRYDEGVFFEFHLKGLGGSGARVDTILRDSIPGYEERNNLINK